MVQFLNLFENWLSKSRQSFYNLMSKVCIEVVLTACFVNTVDIFKFKLPFYLFGLRHHQCRMWNNLWICQMSTFALNFLQCTLIPEGERSENFGLIIFNWPVNGLISTHSHWIPSHNEIQGLIKNDRFDLMSTTVKTIHEAHFIENSVPTY